MKAFTSILHKVTGSQSPIRWDEHNLTVIGSGSSGHVYLAKDQHGMPIAVKKAHIRELDEVKLLSKLSHKNIVKYLGAETREETSYILLEYVPGGSISSHSMKRPFNEDKIRTYTQQLLSGLQYLHQNKVKHGDIKGSNILIDDDECIKLADFGLSKQGSRLWMAPEVLDKDLHNSRFTGKPDIWSVGCTVIEMATGASFLKHMDKPDSVPPIPHNLSSCLKQFLGRCLQREPKSRPSASQLLEDPFITSHVVSEGDLHPRPRPPAPDLHPRLRPHPLAPSLHPRPRPPAPGLHPRPRPPAPAPSLHPRPRPPAPGLHPHPRPLAPSLHPCPRPFAPGIGLHPSPHPPAPYRSGLSPGLRPPIANRCGLRPSPPATNRGRLRPRPPVVNVRNGFGHYAHPHI